MKDSHSRSVMKGVTWRVIASLTTFVLVYLFTGDIAVTLSISVIEVSAKIFFYYLHERVWGKVRWGKLGPEPTFKTKKRPTQKRKQVPARTRKIAVAKRSI